MPLLLKLQKHQQQKHKKVINKKKSLRAHVEISGRLQNENEAAVQKFPLRPQAFFYNYTLLIICVILLS